MSNCSKSYYMKWAKTSWTDSIWWFICLMKRQKDRMHPAVHPVLFRVSIYLFSDIDLSKDRRRAAHRIDIENRNFSSLIIDHRFLIYFFSSCYQYVAVKKSSNLNKSNRYDHGPYIRWLLRVLCAHMKKNKVCSEKKNPIRDCPRSNQMP